MSPALHHPSTEVRSCVMLAAVVLAVAALLSCGDSTPRSDPDSGRPSEQPETQKTPELEGGRLKESVETQKTINRYFQDLVLPKLEPCWNRLQGTGTIEMMLVYARADERWTGRSVETRESGLSADQTAAAAKCMQQAVEGTTLPLTPAGDDTSYALHWSWPVPLPADASERFASMQKDNGGGLGASGCDGHGASARCVTCAGTPVSCVQVCVGGNPPCAITDNPLPGGLRTCTVDRGCASGGLFGVVGGMMRF